MTTTRKIFSTLFSVFRNPNNSLSEMQVTTHPPPPAASLAHTATLALALALTLTLTLTSTLHPHLHPSPSPPPFALTFTLAWQWGGCALVFAGLLLDVASKFFPGKKAAPKKETEMSQVKGEGKAKRTSKAD